MSSSNNLEKKIMSLQEKLREQKERPQQLQSENVCSNIQQLPQQIQQRQQPNPLVMSPARPRPKQLGDIGTPTKSRRQLDLPLSGSFLPSEYKKNVNEAESKMSDIMKMSGILTINGQKYHTKMDDLEHLGELGNGTCGHVVKMRHRPSGVVIAVKQMRRSGNVEENKRIIMDLDVVLKSHDCPYIVQCFGCFITDSDVWICMELMVTCLDKLLKRCRQAIPEDFLGKVTVATVKALSYLKEKHGVIHRDVKPSNILLDECGGVKLCDFGISGRLVDSKAKTRSAGCAAYMAPERIDPPDPTKPDYDIRADVWSLGITLVELATGVFPYRDCKTDFEVLSRVVQDDPPTLPCNPPMFSPEFHNFVSCCLTKNYKQRPKYNKLLEHPFIKKYEAQESMLPSISPGCQWFFQTMQKLEPKGPSEQAQRHYQPDQQLQQQKQFQPGNGHVSLKQSTLLKQQLRQQVQQQSTAPKEPNTSSATPRSALMQQPEINSGYIPYSPYALRRRDMITRPYSPASGQVLNNLQRSYSPASCRLQASEDSCDATTTASRPYSPYSGVTSLTDAEAPRPYSPYYSGSITSSGCRRDSSRDRWMQHQHTGPRSLSPFARDYSPWRRENVDPPVIQLPAASERYHVTPVHQPRIPQQTQHHYQQQQQQQQPRIHPAVAHVMQVNRNDAYASPIMSRKRYTSEPLCHQQQQHDQQMQRNTPSPQLLLSRFAHQMKQEPPPIPSMMSQQAHLASKESAKKRFAGYMRLRIGSDREASPEPPPRFNRVDSPLLLRRNVSEQASPFFPRRYVSPSPPVPPPRRLSESSSVPGSPQHLYTRLLHYTPEPQRRSQQSPP
uniref:mitogen-activated protein kinase kinase n=1 Tax=Trichogramma kaykai TaxID=54128 RepID=A0ABD2XE91_9HYME